MSTRPTPHRRHGASRTRAGRSFVGRGLPAYRPARTPLVSMGPSLMEQQHRRHVLRTTAIVCVAGAAVIAIIVFALAKLAGGNPGSAATAVSRTQFARIGVATGKPQPITLALAQDDDQADVAAAPIQLALPINLSAVTTVGYGSFADTRAMQLTPTGSQANRSFWHRLAGRFLSTSAPSRLHYVNLDGGTPRRVCVGAAPGAQVFSPVSGTLLSIAPNILNGRQQGAVLEIQPSGDANTAIELRQIDADASLRVGATVSAGTSLLGTVRDMGNSVAHPLAAYTHDGGACAWMSVLDVTPAGGQLQ